MLVHKIEWVARKLNATGGLAFHKIGVVLACELPDKVGGDIGGLVGVGGHGRKNVYGDCEL